MPTLAQTPLPGMLAKEKILFHLRGTSDKDNAARNKFVREDTCVQCGRKEEKNKNRSNMVAAHCYEENKHDKVFLITTCNGCNRNGSKDNKQDRITAPFWKTKRLAKILYLLDKKRKYHKSKSDYGHEERVTKPGKRLTNNLTKFRKTTTLAASPDFEASASYEGQYLLNVHNGAYEWDTYSESDEEDEDTNSESNEEDEDTNSVNLLYRFFQRTEKCFLVLIAYCFYVHVVVFTFFIFRG